jgi:hypothetical protein
MKKGYVVTEGAMEYSKEIVCACSSWRSCWPSSPAAILTNEYNRSSDDATDESYS